MDLKMADLNTGLIYCDNGCDLAIEEDKSVEVINKIAIMIKIRAGELDFDTDYGLNWKYFETGNKKLVEEEVRNKILKYFKEVNKINYIKSEFSGVDRRLLNLELSITIGNRTQNIELEVG